MAPAPIVGAKIFEDVSRPNVHGVKAYVIKEAISTEDSDTLTIPGLAIITGFEIVATNGTKGTGTVATNILTLTNGGALTWSGTVWGTPKEIV